VVPKRAEIGQITRHNANDCPPRCTITLDSRLRPRFWCGGFNRHLEQNQPLRAVALKAGIPYRKAHRRGAISAQEERARQIQLALKFLFWRRVSAQLASAQLTGRRQHKRP
jgi:hypothetical protein